MSRQTITSRQTLNWFQNLYQRSNTFDNAYWTKDQVALTATQIANPLTGAVDAYLLADTATSGSHRMYGGLLTMAAGGVYCHSIYVKNNNRRYFALTEDGTSGFTCVLDLTSGTIVSSTFDTAKYVTVSFDKEPLANGWYRLYAVFISKTNTSVFTAFSLGNSSATAGINYVGDGTKSVYIYQAQLVRANWAGFPTSTTTAAITTPIRNKVISRTAITSRASILSPLDPTTVPELMAGAIWLPGIGITTPGGNLVVASQATQTNTLTTSTVTGDIPVQTTAANGAAVWDFSGLANAALAIPKTGILGTGPGVGTALQWTEKGTYAGWFRYDSTAETSKFLFSASWGGSDSRIQVRHNLGAAPNDHTIVAEVSWTGLTTDGTPGNRAKYNSAANTIPLGRWFFLRITIDWSLTNFVGDGGSLQSNRMKVYVDEVLATSTGYSAPGPGALGGDPPDGPIRDPGLWPSTGWFSLGADGISSPWPGQIGPFYIANGEVSDADWARIRLYGMPIS